VAKAENMPQVESESVDLIVTSPPYNLGKDFWPMGGAKRQPRPSGIGYEDARTELEYQGWQLDCLAEMYRVAKRGASLFYNHKIRNIKGEIVHPMDWLRDERNPWVIRQEIVWDRGSTHNHSPSLFWPEDERIYWMTKGKPALPKRPVGMSTIWRFHGPVANTWHPAPFSEELPKRCILGVGRDGIAVLDPFAGSCTTAKVALGYGYDAICVDVCLEYLKKAAQDNGWTTPSDT
jgi:DNA modification methylase